LLCIICNQKPTLISATQTHAAAAVHTTSPQTRFASAAHVNQRTLNCTQQHQAAAALPLCLPVPQSARWWPCSRKHSPLDCLHPMVGCVPWQLDKHAAAAQPQVFPPCNITGRRANITSCNKGQKTCPCCVSRKPASAQHMGPVRWYRCPSSLHRQQAQWQRVAAQCMQTCHVHVHANRSEEHNRSMTILAAVRCRMP
jgi:hypothetical protein